MPRDHFRDPGGTLQCWNCNREIEPGYVMWRSTAPFCTPRCYMNYKEWLEDLGGAE